MAPIDWIIVTVFLIGITTLGVVVSDKNTDLGQYCLAGRRTPASLVTLSLVGASISASSFGYLLQPQVMKVWAAAVFGQPLALGWTWWLATGTASALPYAPSVSRPAYLRE